MPCSSSIPSLASNIGYIVFQQTFNQSFLFIFFRKAIKVNLEDRKTYLHQFRSSSKFTKEENQLMGQLDEHQNFFDLFVFIYTLLKMNLIF